MTSSTNFVTFFETWVEEQSNLHDQLLAAATANPPPSPIQLQRLTDQALSHYEYYYNVKASSASNNVLPMFSPEWTSSTEKLFLWVGGWQPSAAFHLLYSELGLQFSSRLDAFLEGEHHGDLADMSVSQLKKLDELQRKVIAEEREINEEEATVKSTVADTKMVELSHLLTREGKGEDEMGTEMEDKEEKMRKVLKKADGLRLRTLKQLVATLKPLQAVHFLVAAVEVHLRVHELGMKRDRGANGANANGKK